MARRPCVQSYHLGMSHVPRSPAEWSTRFTTEQSLVTYMVRAGIPADRLRLAFIFVDWLPAVVVFVGGGYE